MRGGFWVKSLYLTQVGRTLPADDQRHARVGEEVAVFAGGCDGVEDDLEGVGDGEADDCGLGAPVGETEAWTARGSCRGRTPNRRAS
jgi:hypothetical protein